REAAAGAGRGLPAPRPRPVLRRAGLDPRDPHRHREVADARDDEAPARGDAAMTCDDVRSELIPYHFGVVSPEARPLIEAHLPGCPACVTELVALKRAIELAEDAPRPSDLARARLRAAVAGAIGAAPRR